MRIMGWFVAWSILLLGVSALWGAEMAFEHPSALLDAYDADESCWTGMGPMGEYPVVVVPERWLVGPPPSELTGVTVPTDHWVHLLFSGEMVRADGHDLRILESGAAGERALVFVTDGGDQEYALGMAQASSSGGEILSEIGMELLDLPATFVPRGVRIIALDHGGMAPGFDVSRVQAWVSHACGPRARCPNPVDGAPSVTADATLNWIPACTVGQQVVYFGPNVEDVRGGVPETRYALDVPDANSFEPPSLLLGQAYYWRVTEADANDSNDVPPDDVWSFTVADHVLIDDFDGYGSGGPELYDGWYLRDRARLSLGGTIFRSCPQAMVFRYYYDNFYVGSYSELYHALSPPQDWTKAGAELLEFWLYGDPANATNGQMYVALSDGGSEQIVTYGQDGQVLTEPQWRACRIPLSEFADVNLAHVTSVGIGFRLPEGLPDQSGSGTVYIDDVALRPALCPDDRHPDADLSGDCAVDYRDLEQLAGAWLSNRVQVVPVTSPNEPILWYRFDGDAFDSAGGAHGQIEGRPTYVEGRHGRAICFAGAQDSVVVSQATSVFGRIRDAVTIAFWQCGDDSVHLNDTICCSNYTYGESNPSIAIHLGCWRNPGQYRWDCGTPWSIENRVAGHHAHKSEWAGRWNHWAFIKDSVAGRMEIYLNGLLYDSRSGTDTPIEGITAFQIGSGWYGHYDGLIDEFQIYDHALSAAEVAYLASDGTGVLEQAFTALADLDASGRVDLGDYAILVGEWLADELLP
jgi:hypothetical protein